MSISHRLAKVRPHLPGGIGLMGQRGEKGDLLTAFSHAGVVRLFVTKGADFSPKQAAANFAARLGVS